MGAVEHLKTLCCLGLPPQSAMVAVSPLLHEIIPHGGARMVLVEPDATLGPGFADDPELAPHFRERLWRFMEDPLSPMSLWMAAFRANAIGWTLHMQGRSWLDCGWYREMEVPLRSCWLIDAMIGDAGQTFAFVALSRPRSARPFTLDDMQRLDRLRPWLAHAFRRQASGDAPSEDAELAGTAGAPVRSGEMILSPDAKVLCQTPGLEQLLGFLAGEPGGYTRYAPVRDRLPAPIQKLLRQIAGAASGASNTPPRMQVSTPYGVLALEARWLVPAGALPADAARDPKSCLIAVTIELREHAIAHAARILRESGATPTQTKVGIQLAHGKSKPAIADELGLQLSSVADHAKKLYQTLDVHNSTELATRIWRDQSKTGRAKAWHAG